mmetsp:Transcript_5610/g.7748  ORF Transcript_5610/g.7748 Transcript_5610/m.7748 type:complete len:874 (+) Transcript_5610:141-2762(+)|eukprot:CAMPEP_0117752432 /NCGR_PEP_ID=MMETSP0947-20121206/11604_1 /TAXON_ID=44440 /ORGANISM="Chattonella subsalsa, Strain CCMP2191" /LENGTH=873 /DNA_ID=CAMNT_0005571077 /DNA_START=103 /DNA_END=2724 /DNA_ORIENTATION=+
MASWFRSEKMEYVQLIIQEDAAHTCVSELGRMGVIQFTDLNSDQTAFQRRYVSYIKRCDELERKIRYFKTEIDKFGIQITEAGTPESFAESTPMREKGPKLLEALESDLEKKEAEMLELNKFSETLNTEYNQKMEFHEVLRKARVFFAQDVPELRDEPGNALDPFGAGQAKKDDALMDNDYGTRGDIDMRFSYISGVVKQEDRARFERMLFRATRGNCYIRFAEIGQPIADPPTGEMMHKMVFIVFFKSAAIEQKINKICDAFGASRYHVPSFEEIGTANRLEEETRTELKESLKVLQKNRESRYRLCSNLAQNVEEWQWTLLREKSVYHTLNLFKVFNRGFLSAEGWAVAEALPAIENAVRSSTSAIDTDMTSVVENVPKPWPIPPTYFQINKFTWAFQEFVNTYGVPRYQEANPALFTAATFPFLYGVMYGDIGHGGMVTLFGLYLLLTAGKVEGKRDAGQMGTMYKARYMIFLMGAYSVYCGIIYNDYFAIGLDMFGSKWEVFDSDTESGTEATNVDDYGSAGSVYPFGIDPAWHISSNELLFFNSMKMKTSVILGIIQMTFGIFLRGMNCIYFGDKIGFLFEFLPMLVFDFAMFGYMVVLIFVKWSINWQDRMAMGTCTEDNLNAYSGEICTYGDSVANVCPLDYGGTGDGCTPPNLITTLIGIVLSPGSVDEPMFQGQGNLQLVLLMIIFISIPFLLLGRPLAEHFAKKNDNRQDSFASDTPLTEQGKTAKAAEGEAHGHGEEHHSFSEVFIHQAIETIEFVLGMVSNTASYLRLWALSLAHSELATVFWEKALLTTIEMKDPFFIFVGYAIFAAVTFGVLLCMDVLECFLHALRLHWVEFQNKFYKADGYLFKPFSFADIITTSLEA